MCSTRRDYVSYIETRQVEEVEEPWHSEDPQREGLGPPRRRTADGEPDLLYIDLHLVHEVTSPQAFDGLRLAGPHACAGPTSPSPPMDHNVPDRRHRPAGRRPDLGASRWRCSRANCAEFGIRCYPMGDPGQGIVHVIGPEQGLTQPGMTIVCGDSHTSTHGAFGALAFGIGTSEVEHVLATQTLPQTRPGTMAVTVDGDLPAGVTAKDVILAIIGRIGTGGGIGSVIEYRGSAIRALSMEGRMTVCNMSIEAGATAGLDRPRRHDVRLPRGPAATPRRATAWERGARRLAHAASPTTAPRSTRRSCIDAADARARTSRGARTRARSSPIDDAVPDPDAFADADGARRRRRGRSSTWA